MNYLRERCFLQAYDIHRPSYIVCYSVQTAKISGLGTKQGKAQRQMHYYGMKKLARGVVR